MGVGFAVGFAQSHFEITAIAGLLMLCYFFLPVYRKLNVYTLSDYLSRRYDDRSRVLRPDHGDHYGGDPNGSGLLHRFAPINILMQGDTGRKAVAEAVVTEEGSTFENKDSPWRRRIRLRSRSDQQPGSGIS